MSTAAAAPPSRKLPTTQIILGILLAFVAIIPFTVRLHPFSNEQPQYTASTKPHQLLKPTVVDSSSSALQMQKEIESLENDMASLEQQFKGLTDEMVELIQFNDVTNQVKKTKKQSSNEETEFVNMNKEIKPDRFEKFKEREPKKWWIRTDLFGSSSSQKDTPSSAVRKTLQKENDIGAIIPFDLSVNHLQLVERAPGSPYTDLTVHEEFLPVVLPSDIAFRWRSRARPESFVQDGVKTTAYQIIARRASYSDDDESIILWDSGKVNVPDGLPDVVTYNESKIEIGSVIEWKVTVWDSSHPEGKPSSSDWSKFAVGPSQAEWQGQWISHPVDIESWDKTDASAFWTPTDMKGTPNQRQACRNWEKRSQLPMFRTKMPALDIPEDDDIATALLVVSGLGSFRASLDGKPLSSSGPLDPPLTDFAQRVSYRGFDVTPYLSGDGAKTEHVIGISMGSGWWDHRPIAGSFIRLFFFPHGAVTCVAQLYVTYKSGKTEVVIPTGDESSGWQVAKGHLRESSLFTGEYIDLQSKAELDGWDTAENWKELYSDTTDSGSIHSWVMPQRYISDTTLEKWRHHLHVKAKAVTLNAKDGKNMPLHKLAPIGRLIPHESPPVLPMERVYPDEILDLGGGRWMIDFGKAFSGMLRFESGLPDPIVPAEGYPRGHEVSTLAEDESFITVVYGERLELFTHDINLPLVAGMGLHDGGPRHRSHKKGDAENKGGPCYPKDHIKGGSLLQRDVYILPKTDGGKGSFSGARQSHFTTHAFRFAEICCSEEPPSDVTALAYRSSFKEWGDFSSSNVRINGGYELVKNAMNANLLGIQSDCPHREKIQYGGDILADSPAAMHFYDMSAFYRKVVLDWADQQWDNGAYAGTSYWLMLNDQTGIGNGSGETVWASAPVVMTARHMQHYGDLEFLERTLDKHYKWLAFLHKHFDKGMLKKGYHEELEDYYKSGSGLGDWLSFRQRDTWLTHEGFYMASARSIAYIAEKLGAKDRELSTALEISNLVKDRIAGLYLKYNQGFLPPDSRGKFMSPAQEMGLFSRIVPGDRRCKVLRHYFTRIGHTWPGSAEKSFLNHIDKETKESMKTSGEVTKRTPKMDAMGWSQWHGFNEGIFSVRYALKTLSETGYHNVALDKANGFGVGTWEYMLSHNATTHWESWWRSEDLYSHNHPMLGASAEWMVSAVAGLELEPTTTGGKEVQFWPRFPNSANTLKYAGATQGTRRGDFAIAWEFVDLPQDKTLYNSASVQIHIRAYVPPDGEAVLRLPEYRNGEGVDSILKKALVLPDMDQAKLLSDDDCASRRESKQHGFGYNWEFDQNTMLWTKFNRTKSIGTPCRHFLFHSHLDNVEWDKPIAAPGTSENGVEVILAPGLYDVVVNDWQLTPEVKQTNQEWRIGDRKEYYELEDLGPYCSDSDSFDWNIGDASHLI